MFKKLFRRKNNPSFHAEKLIKDLFGVTPKDTPLYQQALTHKSSADGHIASNERLEYLGDAILDLLVAEYLYHQYPNKNEGFLTKLKAKVVSRKHLNYLANKHGIEAFLDYSGHSSISQKNLSGNALEALIGALYLDFGFQKTKAAIQDHMLKKLVDLDYLIKTETDYKSQLLMYSQREKVALYYEVEEEPSPENKQQYVVCVFIENEKRGTGKGLSKKQAEQSAAKEAWKLIQPE